MNAYFQQDFWGNFDITINVDYPKNNNPIFEKWVLKNYHNYEVNSDRVYLPIQWTAYYVNNNYGNDKAALGKLQDYLNRCDGSLKYWTCIQYDDAILNDVSHLDLLQFNMSKPYDIPIPLICQPHPYKFSSEKKYLVNFIGSRTHPIRNELEKFKGREGWYISYEPHSIEDYCRIMGESLFTICPRGYGLNSFRCCEGLQYDSIPIYLSDIHIEPFGLNFNEYGIKVNNSQEIDMFLSGEPDLVFIADKSIIAKKYYEKYYTYEGCLNQIIKSLEAEYNSRKEKREIAEIDERTGNTEDNGL